MNRSDNLTKQETGKKQETSVAEFIFLLYFAVMLFARAIGLYEGMTAYNITLVVGMLLFAAKIFLTENTLFEYCWMAVLLLISLIVYHNTGEKGLLVYFTMMLGIKGVSLKKAFQTGGVIWSIAFICLLIFSIGGLIPETYFLHIKNGFGYILCHSLGYPHPNVLHIAYIVFMAFITYQMGEVRHQKLFITTGLLFLGNLFVFMYSVSFTGLIAATVFLLFNLYFQLRTHLSLIEKTLVQLIFPFCVAFSVMGPVMIQGRLFEIIDKALNTRYTLSNYFLTQQPITLFGTRFIVPNYRYTMDCSYVYAFMQLGVIPFILICLLFFLLIRDYLRQSKRIELAIILSLCIAGVTEPFMFNLAYKNLIFLFLGEYLFRTSLTVSSALPKWANREMFFIKVGNRPVDGRFLLADNLYNNAVNIMHNARRDSKKYLIIAAVAGLAASGIYIVSVPVPNTVYVNEETINESDTVEPQYLSIQGVQKIRDEGNLVLDYMGDKSPMYAFSGNIAVVEYIRKDISIGLGIMIAINAILMIMRGSRNK